MEVLARGAEAIIIRQNGLVIKRRIKKSYRIRELDLEIRRKRTRLEARIMSEARRIGVAVPKILEAKEFEIIMEFIPGTRVKELVASANKALLKEICEKIGKSVARLHSYDIIHGDLTTSNFIWHEKRVYFIDFGLAFYSKKIEDKAYDLYLLKQAIKATHFDKFEKMWEWIINAYSSSYELAGKVLKRLGEIEKRGRYKLRA